MIKKGIIIKIISNLYTIYSDNELVECHARGKFRNESITPLVGDYCEFDYNDKYILKILDRKNYLLRPSIANVDIALIVTSVKEPNLSLNLLDKMISIVEINNINPVICFTKVDLLNRKERKKINNLIQYYKSIGYNVIINKKYKKLYKILKNKTIVVTGQTGAGKSTLLNKLDKKLNLKTDEISYALGRGKHTTRHVELFKVKDFYVADTPGFSSLDFNNIEKDRIRDSFVEFKNIKCKFQDCMHLKEKDCKVKDLVGNKILDSRYNNYCSFIGEK